MNDEDDDEDAIADDDCTCGKGGCVILILQCVSEGGVARGS